MSEQKLLRDADKAEADKDKAGQSEEEVVDVDVDIKVREIEAEWKPPFSVDQDTITLRRRIGIIERIKIFFTGYSKAESRVRFLYSEFANGYGIIQAKYDLASSIEGVIAIQLKALDGMVSGTIERLTTELSETKRANGRISLKVKHYEEKLAAIDDSYSELKDLYDQQVFDIQDLAQLDKLKKDTSLAKRNATILQNKLTAAENLVEEKEEHIRILQVDVDSDDLDKQIGMDKDK